MELKGSKELQWQKLVKGVLILFFFSFSLVSFLLLFPGLNQHGIITKYIGMAKREINKLLKHKEKKNEWRL